MTEHPTLFNGEMVRAILADRKTQTRRPVTKRTSTCSSLPWDALQLLEAVSVGQHLDVPGSMGIWHQVGPRIVAGDQLWVRETHALDVPGCEEQRGVSYRADHQDPRGDGPANPMKWRPSIHMPRWASRITLDVTAVRVERLRAITEDDILDEGVAGDRLLTAAERRDEFAAAWDDIYAERGYGLRKNPFVWVIEFRRAQP